MSPPPDEKKPVVEPSPEGAPPADSSARSLRLRIRQQQILAELGVLALQGPSLGELLNQTARLTAEGLEAEFCKVMDSRTRAARDIRIGRRRNSGAPDEGEWPYGGQIHKGPCITQVGERF